MWRRGQKRFVGAMPPVDAGMGKSAEHGELFPMLGDLFEVGREFVITPFTFWKEQLGNESKVLIDRDHALGRALYRGGPEGL